MDEKNLQLKNNLALAGVAQWVGHHPTNQKVTSLTPGQGTCLGYMPGPWLGVCKRQPDRRFSRTLMFLSSFSLPLHLSKKINKIFEKIISSALTSVAQLTGVFFHKAKDHRFGS